MGLFWLFAWATLFVVAVGSLLVAVELLRPSRSTFARALARKRPTDPGQLGWAFEEITLVLCDGSLTSGWIIAGRDPQGPVLVVCHGWGESRYDILPRLAPWVSRVSRIVVYDQRGQGESQACLCRLGTWEVDDLGGVLEQVGARLGQGRRVLLGYSMGAGVAMQWAAAHPQKDLEAVVVEGVCPKLHVALAGILRSRGFPAWPIAWIAPWLVLPWAWGAAWRDHRRAAGRLSCPLLVLHGELDPIAPMSQARALAEQAGRAFLVAFPGAGHLGLAELEEKRYVDAIGAILNDARGRAEQGGQAPG